MKNPLLNTIFALTCAALISACSSTAQRHDSALTTICKDQRLEARTQRELLAGGYFAIQNKDLACAERLTSKARLADSNDAYAALNLGVIYQQTGRIELARNEYKQAMALDTNSPSSELAILATSDRALNQSPARIARRNLESLSQ